MRSSIDYRGINIHNGKDLVNKMSIVNLLIKHTNKERKRERRGKETN